MELECRATIEREDDETAWVRWSLTQPGVSEPVVRGLARFDLETVQIRWEEERPPAEQMFLVRTTIDRVVRAR